MIGSLLVVVFVVVVAVLVGTVHRLYWGDLEYQAQYDLLPRGRVRLRRENDGAVMRIEADTLSTALFGMGVAHAHDRMVQMIIWCCIVQGRLSELLVNTPLGKLTQMDDHSMRRAALQHHVPYTTTLSAASAACDAIIAMKSRPLEVRPLQEWHRLAREAMQA